MKEILDSDRFLLFIALLDPDTPKPKRTTEGLVAYFEKLTGWEHNRVLSAFEVCVVKGHIGQQGE
jgi:hypothetical protein